jgi:ketosteroid isomerase-like protein
MRYIGLVVFLSMLGSGTVMSAPVDSGRKDPVQDEATALIQMERQWNEALRTKNAAWFEENLAADVTDINSGNGALSTKADDIAAIKSDTTVYETLELSNLNVRIEGNAGIVTGVNHLKGHDGQGGTFDVRLSFTDTYIKRNGRWLVWASQHTRVR